MANRRRGDREVSYNRAGEQFLSSSGTLPRTAYRDNKTMWYDGLLQAVIPSLRQVAERMPARRLPMSRPAKRGFSRDVQRAYLRRVDFTTAEVPSRVRFCVVRKQRREVLFARGRAGFSGSAPKRFYRRSPSSKYGC